MTLTDDKPPSLVNTYEKVIQPKDKHVKCFFVPPVTEVAGEELALMKKKGVLALGDEPCRPRRLEHPRHGLVHPLHQRH